MTLINTNVALKVVSGEYATVGQGQAVLPVPFTFTRVPFYTDGTSTNQAHHATELEVTVAAGTPVDVDLSAIPGLGGDIAFAKLKALIIENTATAQDAILVVGGAPADAFEGWTTVAGSTYKVPPDSCDAKLCRSAAGFAAGAGKNLRLTSLAGTIVVNVVLIGDA